MPPKQTTVKGSSRPRKPTEEESGRSDTTPVAHNKNKKQKADDASLICTICNQVFQTDGDKVIECERCDKWYCLKCSGLSEKEYEVLDSDVLRIHWYCEECNESAISAVKADNLIEEKCKQHMEAFKEEIDDRFRSVETEVDSVRTDLDTFKAEQTKLNEDLKTPISLNVAEVSKQSIKELRDREARKRNLVLFNIAESDSEETELRIKHDESMVNKLYTDILEIDARLEKLTRLGKKGESPRPLRVTMAAEEDHLKVLKAAKKLAECVHPSYKKISIKRDMTLMEREENKELIATRDKHREESASKGENADWRIRAGKVVNVARNKNPHIENKTTSVTNTA